MTTTCGERTIHPVAVKAAQAGMPGRGELSGMGDFFKVLGDPTRLSILYALLSDELCVCDLGMALGMSVSAVSHQLSVLRQARLVRFRRDGKVVYYSLSDSHVQSVLESIRVHLAE